MTTLSYTVPTAGSTLNSVADPQLSTALTTILSWATTIDQTNITNAFAQAISANTGTQTVKGAVNISASESRSNTAYGTLTTPDQVTGIVLPANGLLMVSYAATWQSSVAAAGNAAIFVGANQLQNVSTGFTSPSAQQAATVGTTALALQSGPAGLGTSSNGGYTGDVTTGQSFGGPAYIFAAAGTYTVAVMFKASSGNVTASNRKLWVQAISFA